MEKSCDLHTHSLCSDGTLAPEALAQELCRRFGLLPSGGSDFHGKNKPDIALGRGRGDFFVPMEFYEGLKEKAQSF